jgi:acyl transferase domain-containing protein
MSEPAAGIAVIGMACRLPGAPDVDAFWNLLVDGGDAVTTVPTTRWDASRYYDPRPATPGRSYSRWGGFVTDIDLFDPEFFGIAPREAAEMDPQQRLALEVAWEALESAGYGPAQLGGSQTGVYLGVGGADYGMLRFRHTLTLNAYSSTGNAHSIVANRISYLLDLHGPSMAVDTACSASLVATHLAMQSLGQGETDLAIVGGVSALLSPEVYVAFCQSGYLAPDGRCKTFDARANGYGRGEGAGIVVLKRLADAVADRDRVLAVLLGSAVNQDGRSNGLNAPNPAAQRDVVRRALRSASVAPSEISYVETHGTGTELGDPIEVSSLAAVLGQDRADGDRCMLGAVKTNIGHLEAAAGIAGLIKTVLAIGHGVVPPTAHYQHPNPKLELDQTPFDIPNRPTPWPRPDGGRRAGVSAFGFGGTNAHIIVGDPPPPTAVDAVVDRPRHVLCLSARTEPLLRTLAQRYADHLQTTGDALPDIAFTANTGRAAFPVRIAASASSPIDMARQLAAFADGGESEALSGRAPGRHPPIGLLCSGHGSHHPGSGRQLYASDPGFREAVDRCDAIVLERLGCSPRLFVLGEAEAGEFKLDLTSQFTLEYALGAMLLGWGLQPHALMGHSLGEYTAATLAGALDLDDALTLVTERGRLMASLPDAGAMAVAFDGEAAVRQALKELGRDDVSVAAVNGPVSTVVSGRRDGVVAALDQLARAGIDARMLRIDVAAHSPLLDPILDEFEQTAAGLRFAAPALTLVSNVTGRAMSADETPDATYWRRHLREPVRFADGMRAMLDLGCKVFVEIGPEPSLLAMGKGVAPDRNLTWLPALRRNEPDWDVLLSTMGALYVHGVPLDWSAFDSAYARHRVALPLSPYERTRHWFDASDGPADQPPAPTHPLLGRRTRAPGVLATTTGQE